jgi:hypothetical protein
MFKLLRYFSISSAVAIGFMTLMVGLMYNSYENNRLQQRTEARAVEDAQEIASAITLRHTEFLKSSSALERDQLKLRWEVTDIDLITRQSVLRKPIVLVELIEPSGRTLYSSRLEKVGSIGAALDQRKTYRRQSVGSVRQTLKDFHGLQGYLSSAEVLRTEIAYPAVNGLPAFVLAVTTDVTAHKSRIDHDIAMVILFTAGLCSILYLVLFLIVARADRIIQAQYNQISRFSARLEAEVADRTRQIADRHSAVSNLMKSAVIRTGTAKEAASEIVKATARVLKVERVSIGLLTEKPGICQVLDHVDLRTGNSYAGPARHDTVWIPQSDGSSIDNLQDIEDIHKAEGVPEKVLENARVNGIRALLNVPISINGKIGGGLAIRDCRSARKWSLDDRVFAVSMANLVAMIIEREEGNRAR